MLLPGSGRIFSRSRIRTPFGKWDSPKSPQGYCCGVADPDFQISGGGGGHSNEIFSALQASVWTKCKGGPSPGSASDWERKRLSGKRWKKFGIRVCREKGAGMRVEEPPPPCFISSTFGIRKQYLIHPHQRQQKQQILYWDSTYK